MNLATVIKKLKRGDQTAFRELVYTYTGRLMTVAKIYTQNVEDAQDVLQDSFILIYQNIEKFNYSEAPAFLAWMRKIVMNEALKKYRKKQFKMETYNLDLVDEPLVQPTLFDDFEKEELIREIYSLPLRYKQVVCLFALEGYSHIEIGEMLGIAASSSRSTYTRAKVILQKRMNLAKVIRKKELEMNLVNELTANKKKCI